MYLLNQLFLRKFLGLGVFTIIVVRAEVKPYISTEAEYNTECKTCPRSLCPNQLAYGSQDAFNVTCWTRGTKIMGDNLWLKSEAGCYITQYDVLEYSGDYTEDLAYCGRASENQHLTLEDATLRWKTECRICPRLSCDTLAYLPEETDVTLTCWTPDGQVIIDDPYWHKTTNNCYVAQKNLWEKPDITYLDNCGPIPILEPEKHWNENGTSDINKRDTTEEDTTDFIPASKTPDMTLNYIVNVTVGEEYAYCRSCAKESCRSQKRYEFNQEVWLQCLVNVGGPNGTSSWWSQTTDFCYMKNTDFWEAPQGDFYRFPLCEYFEDSPEDGENEKLN